MKYSVIVPIYNTKRSLSTCIESILNQSYRELELILVDDGSTDGSSDVCDEYAKTDARVVVVHKENGGLVSARKKGASIATGDYIINVDSDDYLSEGCIERIEAIVTERHPDLIVMGYKKIFQDHEEIVIPKTKETYYYGKELELLKNQFLYDESDTEFNCGIIGYSIWAKIVKKDIYVPAQNMVRESITVGEDTVVSAHILEKCNSMYILHETYYNYIISANSMMNKNDISNFHRFEITVEELKKKAFISPNQIASYSLMNLYIELCKAARSSESLKQFQTLANDSLNCQTIWDLANSAAAANYSIKNKVKLMILKNKRFRLLYLLCRK